MGRPRKNQDEIENIETETEVDVIQTKADKTVKMRRADGKEADVHPSMVSEYALGGYIEVK